MAIETYRVQIEGYTLGYNWCNVLHFNGNNNNDATPLGMAQELIGKVNSITALRWPVCNSVSTVIQWISAKRILPGGGNSWWQEYPEASLKGSQSIEVSSLSLAPIVKLYGGIAEGIQGRIFMPPPADTDVEENVINATYGTHVLLWISDLTSFTEDHDWNLAIYSKKNNAAYSVVAATISSILGQISGRRRPN